jgi:carboxylesterase
MSGAFSGVGPPLMPIVPASFAIALGIALGARQYAAWRRERASERLLPRGEDGIIRGAEPVSIRGGERGAVLLLHGFGDTPQALGDLAQRIADRGWTVRAPLLPGHGRSLPDFARSRAAHWISHARRELEALRATHDAVHLVGLSMGGAIAAILAAEDAGTARAPRSLTLLAPYVDMPRAVRRLARCHRLFSPFVPYAAGKSDRSIHDPEAAARTLGYGVLTPRLLRELLRIVERVHEALPRVAAPTLWVQSEHDNRLTPQAARVAFDRLGSVDKRAEWLDGCGHVITVDYERDRVAELVSGWIESHASPAAVSESTLAPKRAAGTI